MQEAKNTARALVRIGYDGRVYKLFRADHAKERFQNEVMVLRFLEEAGCEFVPRVLEADEQQLLLVTTNCGNRVEQLNEQKIKDLFSELERFGVRHEDPFLRNITYRSKDGRFCLIDFEFATILDKTLTAPLREHATALPSDSNKALTIRWHGLTDIGRFRPNNEDSFLGITFDNREFHYLGRSGEVCTKGLDFVFAVSDGMGGEKSGEFASRFAIENITRLLPRRFELAPNYNRTSFNDILDDLFQSIHRQLTNLGASYAEGRNMGATLSLIWFVRGWLYFAHIGDSRIYFFPIDGPMRQVTEDHTHVGWLRRSGKLNEREARFHPRKNVLSQALGAGNQRIVPQIGVMPCRVGDRIVICSDGVIDGLWDRALEELIRTPPEALANLNPAERLVRTAVAESGRDNATAVVVEIV